MSAPRTKRQFAGAASDPAQRQITSFFTTSTSGPFASPLSSASATQQFDNTANLPASVQANLLSVGMRVRKSVPEGYKTGSYSTFKLWDESGSSYSASGATTMGEGQRSRANAFSSPRELLPFCGIHKIGGLDAQPESPLFSSINTATTYQPTFGVDEADDEYNDMPGLTSTQESIESDAASSPSGPSRKRSFVDDEEVQDANSKRLNMWCHNQHIAVGFNGSDRAIAVPRKARLRSTVPYMAAAAAHSQGNIKVVSGDFEEAEFLDRETWEVDMSDA